VLYATLFLRSVDISQIRLMMDVLPEANLGKLVLVFAF
jgi:hypothetical protein